MLYGSIGALFAALAAWVVLRWNERCPIAFNRVYLACLLWSLFALLLAAGVAARTGYLHPPYAALLAAPALRAARVLDMLGGAALLWRLVPRADAHRVHASSACFAAATVMAIAFGAATALAAA